MSRYKSEWSVLERTLEKERNELAKALTEEKKRHSKTKKKLREATRIINELEGEIISLEAQRFVDKSY